MFTRTVMVHKFRSILFAAAAWLLLAGTAYCQDDQLDHLKKQVLVGGTGFTREKLFVHTDKSFYQPDEIIWMKFYVTDATTSRPIALSKLAYAELVGENGRAVLQGKISIENGRGNGSFVVPAYLPSGNYLLRAYTSWMKNAGPEYFFQQPIRILNIQKNGRLAAAESDDSLFIRFFPEGGQLVGSMVNTVAFQVSDRYGKGINANAILLDQQQDTIAWLKPLRYGLGHFSFTPVAGNTYTAILEGYKYPVRFSLPEIARTGYVMHLEEMDKDSIMRMQVTTNLSLDALPVYLLGYARDSVQFAGTGLFQDGKASIAIDTRRLIPGITTFTLFDMQRRPVCERLFFRRPVAGMDIKLETTAREYGTRKKIDVDISAYAGDAPVVNANFSVAVSPADPEGAVRENIYSYLWLKSELKGPIEDPAYYIYGRDADMAEATNNLMMVHGWRRIIPAAPRLNHPLYLPEYAGPLVQVRVSDRNSGRPVPGITVYLSIPDEHFQFHAAISDSAGTCNFIVNNFYGGGELVLQTDPKDGTNYRLEIADPYSTAASPFLFSPLQVEEGQGSPLNDWVLHAHVQQAFAANRPPKFFKPSGLDTIDFFGKADNTYLLDDYTRFNTMEEVMREYVTDVMVRKNAGKFHFRVRNTPFKYYFDNDPLVLLDGLPVFSVDKIMAIDPLKIKSAAVVARNYYLTGKPFEGIVSYKTYQGNLAGLELDPAAIVLDYEGMQLQREFYSPQYDSEEAANSRIPDFRNVLYWEPDIYTDNNGKAHFSFYSSDLAGDYNVIIQGINAAGKAGSSKLSLSVRDSRQ